MRKSVFVLALAVSIINAQVQRPADTAVPQRPALLGEAQQFAAPRDIQLRSYRSIVNASPPTNLNVVTQPAPIPVVHAMWGMPPLFPFPTPTTTTTRTTTTTTTTRTTTTPTTTTTRTTTTPTTTTTRTTTTPTTKATTAKPSTTSIINPPTTPRSTTKGQQFPTAPTIAPIPSIRPFDLLRPMQPVNPIGRPDRRCPMTNDARNQVHLPHNSDCGRFYRCQIGLAFEFRCPKGQHWNANMDICESELTAGCVNRYGGNVSWNPQVPNWKQPYFHTFRFQKVK